MINKVTAILASILAIPLTASGATTLKFNSETIELRSLSSTNGTPKDQAPNTPAKAAENGIKEELRGLGFSAGVGALFFSSTTGVETATIDQNNILRVTAKSKVRIGALVEAHYMFGDPRTQEYTSNSKATKMLEDVKLLKDGESIESLIRDVAMGPTVVAEIGDNGLNSIGIGLMISFRNFTVKATKRATGYSEATFTPSGNAYNLGVAVMVDPDVKVLASGLEANQALPAGTTIQFETKSKTAIAAIFSAHF